MSGNGALMVAPPFPPEYRAAGLLLHVTSLPSPYGVGDLGASAFSWIDRLHDAGLAWWQALPLGPTGYGNSPYQSMSSFAGNALLISPGELIADGLLQASDTQSHFSAEVVDYDSVIPFKQRLLEKAWANFQGGERRNNQLWSAFDEFCARQANWLEDYALFRALKAKYHGAYYLEWPAELVQRSPSALAEARRELASQIDQVRFAQFLLFRQADQLKEHAHARGVSLIGDLPFPRIPVMFGRTRSYSCSMSSIGHNSSPEFLPIISARKVNCGAIPFTTGIPCVRLVIGGASIGCVLCWLTSM
jgi:4-alpha-glucanotransferase